MKILVINCGSSSLKYQLLNMQDESVLAKGLAERIGIDGRLVHEVPGRDKHIADRPMPDHAEAIAIVLDALLDCEVGVLKNKTEIEAIGHRVVHGGEAFTSSALITREVEAAIKAVSDLAPLHNPPNLTGIHACAANMPGVPQVAVFDTAFHQTMPEKAYLYSLDYSMYEKHKIRRYGFHGTSHFFVAHEAAKLLNKPIENLKIITCHLGNGASVCAVKNGKSVDTSMGLTPLEGLTMGTRSGDIDPAVVSFLMEKEGMTGAEVNDMLNKKSGMLGISGVSSDFRDIGAAAKEGNKRAQAALDIYVYHVVGYIGRYAAGMGGVDAIVFTAGVGENDSYVRENVSNYLEFLGVSIDPAKNAMRGEAMDISTESAKTRVLVVPTNEELVIARDTKKIVE